MIYYHGDAKPAEAPGERHAIVFGINPGDKGEVSRSATRWLPVCDQLTEGYSDTFALAELIQTSTADTTELARKGDIDSMIREDAGKNLNLIATHRPRIIIQCGLSVCPSVEAAYRLEDKLDRIRRPVATRGVPSSPATPAIPRLRHKATPTDGEAPTAGFGA